VTRGASLEASIFHILLLRSRPNDPRLFGAEGPMRETPRPEDTKE